MKEVKPTLTIIAGPNGSGKSTLTRTIQEALSVPIIDPDNEARKLRPDNPEAAAIQGGKSAIKQVRTYLASDESFAAETTLSGNTYLRIMTEAKLKGWQVNLIYIGISNVQTSINRVSQRVAQGGHNVPEADIQRRYTRSNRNLPVALSHADRTIIFDNSTPAGHQIILTIENGKVTSRAEELPEWLKTLLPQEIIEQIQN